MKKNLWKRMAVLACLTAALNLCACGNTETAVSDTPSGEESGADAAAADTQQEETPSNETETVTIYATNDMHGVVEGDEESGTIGLDQIAGIAASTENAVLVDAGDALQGASFATVGDGAHMVDMMNAAGYVAMAAGNHEFDRGADRLLANAEAADFPILSANAMQDGEPLLDAYTIVDVAGHKIGFIGVTTTNTLTSANPMSLGGVSFENEVETVEAAINEIKDETDAIILLAHLGDLDRAADVTSTELLEGLSEDALNSVTAVIDGHSHDVENTELNGIPILQTGTRNQGLDVLTIDFGSDGYTVTGDVMDYAAASAFELNEDGEAKMAEVQAAYEQCLSEIDPILAEDVALSGAPVWGGYIYYDYAEPRIVETTMGDLVTDAFRYYGEKFAENNALTMPVIGIENGGGISATFPYGSITRGDILNAFNHGNTVDVMKITPAQLYAALEGGLAMTGQDDTGLLVREDVSGSFLQVSGLTYTYDPAAEAGSKVVSVVLDDGTELARDDEKTELMMATNNYVSGFDAFTEAEKLGELGGEDAIVQDYVLYLTNDGKDTLTIDNVAGRIVIANDKSPENYEVVIPVKAAEGEYDFSGQEFEVSVDNGTPEKVSCEADGLHLTVAKGAHTIYLTESSDAIPVYVNNYSGSGTVTTADGYFHLYFTVDPEELK